MKPKKAGFVKCGPNEVLVVSGGCRSKIRLIQSGRTFVWPLLQKVQRITLSMITIALESPSVLTKEAVPLSVTTVACVKIEGQKDKLIIACNMFANRKENEIGDIARDVLEGHQRAIIGSMLVEDILSNQEKFARKVTEAASDDLSRMGLTVISCIVKNVLDATGFVEARTKKKIAELHRDLRIEEAEAKRDSTVKQALQEQMYAKIMDDHKMEIAQMERNYLLEKHSGECEIKTKEAEAAYSDHLEALKNKQRLETIKADCELLDAEKRLIDQDIELNRGIAEFIRTTQELDAGLHATKVVAESQAEVAVIDAETKADLLTLAGEVTASLISSFTLSAPFSDDGLHHANEQHLEKISSQLDLKLETDAPSSSGEREPEEAEEASFITLETKSTVIIYDDNNNDKSFGEVALEAVDIEAELEGYEDLVEVISKVHGKVCDLTGIDIGNALLAAVFQEVLELFK
ncbi:Flotillin-1 [Halotydeus destructor]|nr:Flotillin-1 [Halotydeus destructor]